MKSILSIICLFGVLCLNGQNEFEPNEDYPYGSPNPEAPAQLKDYEPLIGLSDCKSVSRKPDGSWNPEIDMTWEFRYIMNGMAVQDQTLKDDGAHAGSIRQYIADSSRWYVHYYSNTIPTAVLPAWEGNRQDDKMILYRDQKAPNGMEGMYKITFYEMRPESFKWKGEWVNKDESIIYPTWTIACKKRKTQ
ncbi:MAG: hypothetical protein HKN00_03680 [Flavobacteriaceae bacterium]|nr:hypothetical protein [Bacteroidia bacterium]NNF74260.1 hypothetical protein [Flavobacteriaceae bacterium]NNK72574.1 hypothetical protein [Flavobacteriaceae bacterium]